MTPRLSEELRLAIQQHPEGQPLEVVDPDTQAVYVVVSKRLFERLQGLLYDASDLAPEEQRASLARSFGGPDGWDAPGMDDYDRYDASHPQP